MGSGWPAGLLVLAAAVWSPWVAGRGIPPDAGVRATRRQDTGERR
jgi:hypothetical protein